MSKRNRHPDPDDPAQWLSQPYTPHDPSYYLTGRGRFLRSPFAWAASKGSVSYGCLLATIIVLVWAGLFAIGLIAASGFGPWVLGALALAAVVIIAAFAIGARRLHHIRKAQRHHKQHAAHRHH